MTKAEITEKVKALVNAPSCCAPLKELAEAWLKAQGLSVRNVPVPILNRFILKLWMKTGVRQMTGLIKMYFYRMSRSVGLVISLFLCCLCVFLPAIEQKIPILSMFIENNTITVSLRAFRVQYVRYIFPHCSRPITPTDLSRI